MPGLPNESWACNVLRSIAKPGFVSITVEFSDAHGPLSTAVKRGDQNLRYNWAAYDNTKNSFEQELVIFLSTMVFEAQGTLKMES